MTEDQTEIARRVEQAGLRVKPLEFNRDYYANADHGSYFIRTDYSLIYCKNPGSQFIDIASCDDLDSAIAAANAHHAEQVLAMLEVDGGANKLIEQEENRDA